MNNKTPNTKENKSRFFAQYWGQYLMFMPNNTDKLKVIDWFRFDDCYLELIPLSEIKEEDIKFICLNIAGVEETKYYKFESEERKDFILEIVSDFESTHIVIVDYLRSKGYAIPFMNFSVEDLVEMNWVKLL